MQYLSILARNYLSRYPGRRYCPHIKSSAEDKVERVLPSYLNFIFLFIYFFILFRFFLFFNILSQRRTYLCFMFVQILSVIFSFSLVRACKNSVEKMWRSFVSRPKDTRYILTYIKYIKLIRKDSSFSFIKTGVNNLHRVLYTASGLIKL